MTHQNVQCFEIQYDEVESLFIDLDKRIIDSNVKSNKKINYNPADVSLQDDISINQFNERKKIIRLVKVDYNKVNPFARKLKQKISQCCSNQNKCCSNQIE